VTAVLIVTNLSWRSKRVVPFYNGRGAAATIGRDDSLGIVYADGFIFTRKT